MASVYWTDKTEESLLEIGRYIIERTQSRQGGLDVINRIEQKCDHPGNARPPRPANRCPADLRSREPGQLISRFASAGE
jgi:hypothetical protein